MKAVFSLVVFIVHLLVGPLLEAHPAQSIAIVTYQVAGAPPWDPEGIKTGMNGSEEAVVYISQHLVDIGYQVTVFGDPPEGSIHSKPGSNPLYVNFNRYDGSIYDIAIAWRTPYNAQQLKKMARKVYLWPHDTYDAPLSNEQILAFDGVLWISEWQRNYWISRNPAFKKFKPIFGNGINPEQFQPVEERPNPYSCIYGSNYARGLEVLLDIWPQIKAQYPQATLDIYYGWQHWGLLHPQQERKMRLQIDFYRSLDVREHGLVSHEELNQAYHRASFWTYPCICPEVFCISALRAQLAGAVPVIIEGSALSETVRSGYKCETPSEYLCLLKQAMSEADKITVEQRRTQGQFVLKEYTWKAIAQKWKELFDLKK
ncbi:MAG: glycosyltransferase family 4 protein [Parachlamydiaceae bacterium]